MFKTFLPFRVLRRFAAGLSSLPAAVSAGFRVPASGADGEVPEDIFFLALAKHGHW